MWQFCLDDTPPPGYRPLSARGFVPGSMAVAQDRGGGPRNPGRTARSIDIQWQTPRIGLEFSQNHQHSESSGSGGYQHEEHRL